MPRWQKTKQPSVYVRHQAACPVNEGGARCRCAPSYYAQARHPETKRVVKSQVVHNFDEAAGWLVDFKRGRHAEPISKLTVRQMCDGFLKAAADGSFRPRRSDTEWSDNTLELYGETLERHIYPAKLGAAGTYGDALVESLDQRAWQALIDTWHRKGFAYNSIVVMLAPVRSAYRWACAPSRRLVAVNTTTGLEMPVKKEKARDRIATPTEVLGYLAVLPDWLRVVFALAFYAGMRRREIRVARWEWVDFKAGVIHVRISKTKKGVRDVPLVAPLRSILLKWADGVPDQEALVVPGPRGGMWSLNTPLNSARAVWKRAKLEGVGLHECRHSYASFSIAAGVNAKSLQTYMGHATIQETFDRYGHLMPGNEAEAAELQDTYLRKAVGE